MTFILQQLVKKGLLDKEKATQLEYEIKNSGKKEEELILEKRIVSEQFLFDLKSELLKTPLKKVNVQDIPSSVLELISEETARFYRFVPIGKNGKVLEIGMVYPEDIKAKEALEFLSRRQNITYEIFLITLSDFSNILKRYRNLRGEVTKALEALKTELDEVEEVKPSLVSEFEKIAEEAPISKIVNVILRHAVDGEASDIHIEPTKEKIRVRFRLDGVLHSSIFLPLRTLPAIISRIKILSNLKIDETRVPQDGRFTLKVSERDIDFRVSTFPTVLGEKVVMRVLDSKKAMQEISNLGISERNLKIIKNAVNNPYGMILVTGPTGSGKTTTLYAVLRLLNKEGVNIMTLEDPVEYFIEGINQSQVKPEIGYEFSTGLRHMLRQDPDILMVGEIRDSETASLAVQAALTGHLLLSTIHTNNSVGVIPRLIDLGVKPFLIPPTLSVVIAQRLVRVLCSECKKRIKPKLEVRNLILEKIKNFPEQLKSRLILKKDFYIMEPGSGCGKCHGTGYSGRTGIFEVLEMNDRLSEIVLKDPSEIKILKEAKKQGMITMENDGILKILEGITSFEETFTAIEK